MTLDLAQPSIRRHGVADQNEYWSLTDMGKDLLKFIRLFEFNTSQPAARQATAKKATAKKATAKKATAKKATAKKATAKKATR
jgi:topoisomerase IA-like protein